jgi:hypothetical protein
LLNDPRFRLVSTKIKRRRRRRRARRRRGARGSAVLAVVEVTVRIMEEYK